MVLVVLLAAWLCFACATEHPIQVGFGTGSSSSGTLVTVPLDTLSNPGNLLVVLVDAQVVSVADDGSNRYEEQVSGSGPSTFSSVWAAPGARVARTVTIRLARPSAHRIWVLEYAGQAVVRASSVSSGKNQDPVEGLLDNPDCMDPAIVGFGNSNQRGNLPDAPCAAVGGSGSNENSFVCAFNVTGSPPSIAVQSSNQNRGGQWLLIVLAVCPPPNQTVTAPGTTTVDSDTVIDRDYTVGASSTLRVRAQLTVLGNMETNGKLDFALGGRLVVSGNALLRGKFTVLAAASGGARSTSSAIRVEGNVEYADAVFEPVLETEPRIGETIVIQVAEHVGGASGVLAASEAMVLFTPTDACLRLGAPVVSTSALSTVVTIETSSSCVAGGDATAGPGLSKQQLIGIGVGCGAVFLLIVVFGIFGILLINRRRLKQREHRAAVLKAAEMAEMADRGFSSPADLQAALRRSRTGSVLDLPRDITGDRLDQTLSEADRNIIIKNSAEKEERELANFVLTDKGEEGGERERENDVQETMVL